MQIFLTGKFLLEDQTRSEEVFDVNANVAKGTFDVNVESKIPLEIAKNDSGYGNIRRRNVTNNGPWVGASFLHEGDEVDLP